MRKYKVKYFWILLAFLCRFAFAGPPEPPIAPIPEPPGESLGIPDIESAKKLEAMAKIRADSLSKEAAKTKITVKSAYKINIDSMNADVKLNLERARELSSQTLGSLDTSQLLSFKEIIIDENGIIKALTDSGLIVLDESLLVSIVPVDLPDSGDGGRKQITRWGENVIVDEESRVNSDIQVVRANVTVKGVVNGDVTTMGGDIYVTSTGVINGNAVAVGGKVKKDDGARITGATMQLKLPLMNAARDSTYQLILGIVLLVILLGLLFAWLMVALVPVPMNRIAEELARNPFKSFLFGYILYIGLPIAWVLLLVTILGIPVALLVIPLAFPLAIVQAYAAINIAVGRRLFKKENTLQAFIFGGLATTTIPLLIMIIGYATNSLALFVINMIFLGFFLFLFVPFGLGAALNTRFGFNRKDKKTIVVSAQVNI